MSERDAFGRGRYDDTLAGMGWREPTFMATLKERGDGCPSRRDAADRDPDRAASSAPSPRNPGPRGRRRRAARG